MIYPSNNPPVCLIGCQPCSFYGINYAMLKSLVSIQNGRVCYQGCPPNMGSDVDIERLNEAIKIVIEAFPYSLNLAWSAAGEAKPHNRGCNRNLDNGFAKRSEPARKTILAMDSTLLML